MPRQGLLDCLDGKVKAGRLTRKQAEFAAQQVRDMETELARRKTRTEAQIEAEERIRRRLEADAARKQARQARHLLAVKRTLDKAQAHPNGFNPGLRGVLDTVAHGDSRNVTSLGEAYLGALHGFFADAILGLRPRLFGMISNHKRMELFLRGVFGEQVNDADAAAFAKGWKETTDLSLELANRKGADIRYRHDWHVPHREDAKTLKRKGYQYWRDRVMRPGYLARNRMLHPDTGAPVTDLELEAMLPEIWQAKMTSGLSAIVPGADPTLAQTVAKLEHHRFLQFANADAWLDYHREFGRGSIFRGLMAHLDYMAREIALLDVLGPKHSQVMRQMLDRARMQTAKTAKRVAWVDQPDNIEAMYRKLTGELDRLDGSPNPRLVRSFEEIRSFLASVQLGSAIISAISDMKTFSKRAGWNGLRRWRAFREAFAQMNPGSSEHRRWAIRRGLIAENASMIAFTANRFQDRVAEGQSGAWLAQLTTTATGLNGWTQAFRFAHGMEWYATIAEHAKLGFDKLPQDLRRAFEAHGFAAADWDVIRSTPRVEPEKGADFFDPLNLMRRTDLPREQALDVAIRLLAMINQEKDLAVIVKRPTTEALASLGTERRTIGGQLTRMLGMYKNFVITWTLLHGQQARQLGPRGGLAYMLDLFIGMTALGAISMTVREVSKGRDPPDAGDWQFWARAAFQGGGLGVLGDFMYTLLESGQSRHGHDPVTTLLGPVAGLTVDTTRLIAPNVRQLFEGEETGFVSEAIRFGRRYNPLASWWYLRTVVDRMGWDQLQGEIDPDAGRAWRRMEKRARTDFGQKFWWAPGDVAPQRAPDLGAIAGGSE